MSLEQIRELIEQNKDNQEVINYLQGFAPKNELTLEGVQKYVDSSEDAKKWLQSQKDSYFSKGLESWKEKTLPELLKAKVEEEISQRYPAETEEQKRLRQLEQEIANERKERQREKLVNLALTEATNEGLPTNLVGFFVGQDEESTRRNIETFKATLTAREEALRQQVVDGVFKQNSREPHKDNKDPQNDLQQRYQDALKAGKLEDAIALKNKIWMEQRKE